jgi:hypothetical protein
VIAVERLVAQPTSMVLTVFMAMILRYREAAEPTSGR